MWYTISVCCHSRELKRFISVSEAAAIQEKIIITK